MNRRNMFIKVFNPQKGKFDKVFFLLFFMLKEKDFIEIEFTGRTKEGEIFDSNIKEDLEKANLNFEPKPFAFCLGQGMFLKGVEDFLIGKSDKVENYEISLSSDNAFEKRNPKLIQLVPSRVFMEQKLNPVKGMMFNFDGRIAKILSVSGGRVIADFNNPVAGKDVVYNVRFLRKISDINEKAGALIDFLFRRKLDFEIKDKKIIILAEKGLDKFVELFKDKFNEILDLELETRVVDAGKKKEEDKKSQK